MEGARSEVEATIREVIATGDDLTLDDDLNLLELGLDSLAAAELSSKIEALFGVEYTEAMLMANPTISAILQHASEKLGTIETQKKIIALSGFTCLWLCFLFKFLACALFKMIRKKCARK